MYYVLKNTRHDFGDLTLFPEQLAYIGDNSGVRPTPDTIGAFNVKSPSTRRLDTDFIRANRGKLCSQKLKDILESSNARLLFFPVQCTLKNGEKVNDSFYLIHCENHLDCLDLHNSDFEGKDHLIDLSDVKIEDIDAFYRVAIYKNKVGNCDFFYIKKVGFGFYPIVSEELAMAIQTQSIKGVEPLPLSDFEWEF